MRELEQVFRRALVAYQTVVPESPGRIVAPENVVFSIELPGAFCPIKNARLSGWRVSLCEDGSAIADGEGSTFDNALRAFDVKVEERVYQVREMLK